MFFENQIVIYENQFWKLKKLIDVLKSLKINLILQNSFLKVFQIGNSNLIQVETIEIQKM